MGKARRWYVFKHTLLSRISSPYQAGNICSQSPSDTRKGQVVLFIRIKSPLAIIHSHPIAIYVGISGRDMQDDTVGVINSKRQALIHSVQIPTVMQAAVTQALHLHFHLGASFSSL